MHAQLYPPFSDRFKESIKEGIVCYLSYFRARNSDTNYRPVANDLMLVFTKWTKIEEVVYIPPSFLLYAYSLASMDELQARMDGRGQFSEC
jgi:replication factor A1